MNNESKSDPKHRRARPAPVLTATKANEQGDIRFIFTLYGSDSVIEGGSGGNGRRSTIEEVVSSEYAFQLLTDIVEQADYYLQLLFGRQTEIGKHEEVAGA